jgi:hypothetical protein
MSDCPVARGELSADSVLATMVANNTHLNQLFITISMLGTGLALSAVQGFYLSSET